MPGLSQVEIYGFKTLKNVVGFRLDPLNVLIGVNGAGKSNMISFFRMLKAISESALQKYVGVAGGANALLYHGAKETSQTTGITNFLTKTGESRYEFRLEAANDTLVFATEGVSSRVVTGSAPRFQLLGSGHRETGLKELEHGEVLRVFRGLGIYHFEDTSPSARVRKYIAASRTTSSYTKTAGTWRRTCIG